MNDDHDKLRAEIERRVRRMAANLPSSSLGRLSRAAFAALRGGRLALGKRESLDVDALSKLVSSLGQLKGVAMKVGQVMSYLDLDLPEELRAALTLLQTQSPAMSFVEVRAVVETELGDRAAELLTHMDAAPAAAASIGQVHRGRLDDGTEVAVKVQYPEIERAVAADFRAAAIGATFASLIAPNADVDGVVNEAKRALLEECDYDREAAYQERFGAIFRDHGTVVVPDVHRRFSARRVLTTTWMNGASFDAFLGGSPAQPARDAFGRALFEFYVGTLLRHGLCNWDPHPGNYIALKDGHVAMLDYGSTREFDPNTVKSLRALTLAMHLDERQALHAAFVELGIVHESDPYDFGAVREIVRSLYGPMLRDKECAITLGEARPFSAVAEFKREMLKLHLRPELLFLFRVRFGIMSVLARLGAHANWRRIERGFADDQRRVAAERGS
jgi:predicted unusual protein kinase regulating ubiquinone biosynthesis (AarF/ABC1/UbiB family)